MKTIALIGIGNILFWDEGIGIYAAEYMRKNYRFIPDIEIVDGGTLGFGLLNYLREFDCVVLVDTLSLKTEAGEVFLLPHEALNGLGDVRRTAHEVEVSQMLEIVALEGNHAQVTLVGVVPADIRSVGLGLSAQLQHRFDHLIQALIGHLKSLGIDIEPTDSHQSLESIISGYLKR